MSRVWQGRDPAQEHCGMTLNRRPQRGSLNRIISGQAHWGRPQTGAYWGKLFRAGIWDDCLFLLSVILTKQLVRISILRAFQDQIPCKGITG